MWFKRSLLSKVIVGMLISAVVPLIITIAISYRTTTQSVQNQVIDLNQHAMESSMYVLKRYLDDLSHVSIQFYYDSTIMDYLRSKTQMDYNKRQYISNQVYTVSKARPEFRAARFTSTPTGLVFTSVNFLQLGEDDHLDTGSTMDTDPAGWTGSHGYNVVTLNGQKLLAFHQPMFDYPRPTLLGVLSIYVGPELFERLVRPFSSTAAEGERMYLMIRQDRQLLYAMGGQSGDSVPLLAEGEIGQRGSMQMTLDGQNGVVLYLIDEFKGMPLTLVKFIPSAMINDAADQALRKSLVVPFLMTVIVFVCAFALTYKLVVPIKRLVRNMAKVETGNFETQPVPLREDELGVLEQRFQSMVRGLDDLMNREYRSRLELTTARLKMLQAQINPHFLYNSLQSIGTLALRHGASEINDRIAELGSILRYSMDLNTETVPLQKEIEHMEAYLSLQGARFKNRLSFTMSCAEEARYIPVPKMILQPLVENSIIHGIEKGNGFGTLHIGIELTDELVIRVMDNGKGIDEETITKIRWEYEGRLPASGQERGIGLINVLTRLRLRYDDKFVWELKSVPYEATVITLRISLQ
ncbi:sensor histidine kinase [Paenibacillus chartarius]|uniref:Sensor histidine kinase n=1 Tax=Paenibacillus chartarius TaxID=747481 RepID=A0ABV6DTP0_9BACL